MTEPADQQPRQTGGADARPDQVTPEQPGSVVLSSSDYEELKALANERDDFLRRLQRAVADCQNLQKRMDQLRESARETAVRDVTREFLSVADSLSRARESAEQCPGAEPIVRGLLLVEKEFYDALARMGIRPLEAVGRPFDPRYHDAVMQESAADVKPNTVVRELKKGFVMGDVVVRPSQVIVTPPGALGAGENDASDDA